ncbi:MAG: gliding motility-associated C-terminal domain-containing protein [Bacteroidota bacterium]
MSKSRLVHIKFITGLILCLFSMQLARAQISSVTADRVDSLAYEESTEKDPLFIFHQLNQGSKPGELSATLAGSGSYNFAWSKYNPELSGFDPPFSTESGVSSSGVSDLDEGGYQVRVWNSIAIDTIMTAWVMLDNFLAEVEKNASDMLPAYKYTCDFVVISGFVTPDTITYYDLVSHNPIRKIPDFRFKWTSDNDELKIPNDTIILDPNITFLPPYEDTWYILTAVDEFGMTEVDSVHYESIQTKAEFTVEYYDKVAEEYDADLSGDWSAPDPDNPKGSTDAMLTVRFDNISKNGASFEWVFLDTIGGIKQSETTYDTATYVEFTYERADEYYYPYMVSASEAGCIDSFQLAEPIFVMPSKLEIPNVFSPNSDQMNDVWMFKHQSLEKCRITIVDRTGKVAYKARIDDIYSWEGWDGNMHNSNRRAPEGQYYYVVEALGYDAMEYRDQYVYEKWKIFGGTGNTSGQNPGTGGSAPPGGQDPETASQNLYTGWLYLYRHSGTY